MLRTLCFALIFSCLNVLNAQDEVRLPADLRQHNLTTYNSSLFNATYSLDRNDPESVAFWTRWQWQSIDADPTTLFVNYSRKLNEKSAVGAAFFQHNTGIFFNTGGVINYAYQIQFSESVRLAMGFNLFGFSQELADTRFQNDPNLPVPLPGTTNDFILQWAPGVSISVERMTLSMASENLLDYNFRAKEANTPAADKIFMGMMSYDFPLSIGSQNALLRPSLYLRTIPQQENQIGILSLLRTSKYWAQLGYNNFYGVGVGGGGTFFKRFNLGAVFEFGTSASINSKDPSFEIVASYFLGNPDERDVAAVYEDGLEEEVLIDEELTEEEKVKEELEKAEELANEEKEESKEEEPNQPKAEEEVSPEEEVVEPTEEPITEEVSKKEQRQAEKEAAAETKRLKKEQEQIAKEEKEKLEQEAKEKTRLAKEEQAQIEREMKEAKAKKEEEAKQVELVEKQKEELRMAEEKAAERAEELKRETETREATQKREAEEKAEALRAATQRRQDSIAEVQNAAQEVAQQAATKKRMDSLAAARKIQAEAEAQAIETKRKLDSVAQAKAAVVEAEKEEVKPEAGEKYEEVQTEDGLEPGFYLIANVFGTKKYFDAFMADLTNRGLSPKSFLRSKNNYNYAYLERYDTMAEARRARDSKFNGKYTDKTWVFRVVGK